MPTFLSIAVRFLQPYCHGRGDGDEPEWPPSPLRLFQAMVAASAGCWNERTELISAASALNWLEAQKCAQIVAGDASPSGRPYRLFVPDNVGDRVAASWCRGRDASIADYRTEKNVSPMQLSADAVHYLYPLSNGRCPHLDVLTAAARGITHLGWGIDMAVGNASIMSESQVAALDGHRWRPTPIGGTPLRVPTQGTLDDLMRRYKAFLNRLSDDGFRPVPPLKVYRTHAYRRDDEPLQRCHVVFELHNDDGSFFRYPQSKLIHIAGMVRHLAIEAMKTALLPGVPEGWVRSYVAGHAGPGATAHRQFSYLPLCSIGHEHTDPAVRRVMVTAPVGDDHLLQHLAARLEGQQLRPTSQTRLEQPPTLVRIPKYEGKFTRFYTQLANNWASVTPVILPGHDDHKPAKTRRLIEKALAQSGVDQPCEFQWSAFSRFPKVLSAHKFARDGRPTGYIRPPYLLNQTAVHLRLQFKDNLKMPGPLAIGAGRHCGLGLLARCDGDYARH